MLELSVSQDNRFVFSVFSSWMEIMAVGARDATAAFLSPAVGVLVSVLVEARAAFSSCVPGAALAQEARFQYGIIQRYHILRYSILQVRVDFLS